MLFQIFDFAKLNCCGNITVGARKPKKDLKKKHTAQIRTTAIEYYYTSGSD